MKHSKEYYWNKYYNIPEYDRKFAEILKTKISDVPHVEYVTTWTKEDWCPVCGMCWKNTGSHFVRRKHLFSHFKDSRSYGENLVFSHFLLCPHCSLNVAISSHGRYHTEQELQKHIYSSHYGKPWKDEESLFCDKDFLEKYLNKEIALGDECKE